jgi:hypothetical protein
MTAPASAMDIADHHTCAEACVQGLAARGAAQARDDDEAKRLLDSLRGRGNKVTEAWQKLVTTARHEAAGKRSYSPFDKDKTAGKALLYTVLDESAISRAARWPCSSRTRATVFPRSVPKDAFVLSRTKRSPSDTAMYDAPAGDT